MCIDALDALPAKVRLALETDYNEYEIEEVEFLENPSGSFYEIEVENNLHLPDTFTLRIVVLIVLATTWLMPGRALCGHLLELRLGGVINATDPDALNEQLQALDLEASSSAGFNVDVFVNIPMLPILIRHQVDRPRAVGMEVAADLALDRAIRVASLEQLAPTDCVPDPRDLHRFGGDEALEAFESDDQA